MRKLLRYISASEYRIIFCLSIALVFAEAYNTLVYFELDKSGDPRSYWGLAHFDFEQVAVRKYRVIIPFIAAGINWVFVHLANLIRPGSLTGDYAMKIAFFIPNMICTGVWCTLIYRIVRELGCSKVASLIALAMAATAHYTILNAGTPMVDAFFYCTLGFALLGGLTGNNTMLFWSIIIGPFAKESFVFMIPVLLVLPKVPKVKLIVWVVLSGVLQLGYRYAFDRLAGHPVSEALLVDVDHVNYFQQHLHRFIEITWLHDIFSFIGLWPMFIVAALVLIPTFKKEVAGRWRLWVTVYLLMVLVQMLLSGELGRMLYISLPVYAWVVAIGVDAFRKTDVYKKVTGRAAEALRMKEAA